MAIKKYKPTTPGRRGMTVTDYSVLSKVAPERSLLEPNKKHAGRNNTGKITVRHHGGGNRTKYRVIDFKRNKFGVPATVKTLEYDPNRSAFIALVEYEDGAKSYILAPDGLKVGDKVMAGPPPAMNGHRSAFDGRNFEYYSEDSVLAGYIGASSIAGAQSYGVYAYMKHFALNDQQTNQSKLLCTWADEQAIREIYLRPFEISAKVGGCKAVMSSWNYIGNQWAGACNALLNGVLRGEWGFRGMVITDGFHFTDYMDSDRAIRNGCDLMLKNYDVATNHLTDTTSATGVKAMRQACKNIMYTVVNSRVYDPANTVSTPIWRTAMIVVNVLLAVLLVVLEVLTFKSYKKKKAQ